MKEITDRRTDARTYEHRHLGHVVFVEWKTCTVIDGLEFLGGKEDTKAYKLLNDDDSARLLFIPGMDFYRD